MNSAPDENTIQTLLTVLESTFSVTIRREKDNKSENDVFVFIQWWMGTWLVDWGWTPFEDHGWWRAALQDLDRSGVVSLIDGTPHTKHQTAKEALDFVIHVIKYYDNRVRAPGWSHS